MPNLAPHHFKNKTNTLAGGAAPDLGAERPVEKEFYRNAKNMRPTGTNDNLLDMERIRSNKEYISTYLSSGYKCHFADFVFDKIFSVWVDENDVLPATIFVDDIMVCQSLGLPFNYQEHFHYTTSDNGLGGDIIISNNNTPPIVFSVQDMVDSIGTDKYFADFNIEEYQIGLQAPLDRPVIKDIYYLGGNGGLENGKYAYGIRYVDESGNKTAISPMTPLVPIPESYVFSDGNFAPNNLFPFLRSYGGYSTGVGTGYGVRLRFRVNNVFNFSYMEVIRIAYAEEEFMEYIPEAYVVKRIDLSEGEISVREYIDGKSTQDTPVLVPKAQLQSYISQIKSAYTVKYVNNTLVLGNITYETTDVDDISFIGENTPEGVMQPITQLLSNALYPHLSGTISESDERVGYSSARNVAYKSSYMHSEKYGFAIVGLSTAINRSFAKWIPSYESYEFPQRRRKKSSAQSDASYHGVTAAAIDNLIGETFEIFDLVKSTRRETAYDAGQFSIYLQDIPSGTNLNYNPRRPTKRSLINSDHHIRSLVNGDGNSLQPRGFGLRYHALGIELNGLDDYPEWMRAFHVVRTKPAKRVICQGLATYRFPSPANKDLDKVVFYSPDIENGLVSPDLLAKIQANPSDYKILCESPIGFFPEIFSKNKDTGTSDGSGIDMMLFARVLLEDGTSADRRINPGEAATDIGTSNGTSGYVNYGKWRNAAHSSGQSIFADESGDFLIGILDFYNAASVSPDNPENLFVIQLDDNLYKTAAPGGQTFGSNARWFEPFYIISIIDDSAEVDTDLSTEFFPTDCYQKIKALFGRVSSDMVAGDSVVFEAVDERPDDWYVLIGDTSTNKYIFIDDGSGFLKRFINRSQKLAGDLTTIQNDINNGTTVYCGFELYGTYDQSYDESTDTFSIVFNNGTTLLSAGTLVYVVYDNRFPLKIFGGDVYNGDAYYSRIDRENGNESLFDTGMPYYVFNLNPNIYFQVSFAGALQHNAGNENVNFYSIRQMGCSFPATSRSLLSLAHENAYPLIGYVDRPYAFNADDSIEDNNVHYQYSIDYPDEMANWSRGGIKYGLSKVSIDYSKYNNYETFFAEPYVGFQEETRFPHRVAWSAERSLSSKISPSLRTFPFTNVFDIPDEKGEIKKFFDSTPNGRGTRNLIALTQNGGYELYLNKISIESVDGQQLTTIGLTGYTPFISNAVKLDIPGLPDYFWRFYRELDGQPYWADRDGFYMFGGELKRINNLYTSKLLPILKQLPEQYSGDITTFVSVEHREYGFIINISGAYTNVTHLSPDGTNWYLYTSFSRLQMCVDSSVKGNAGEIRVLNIPSTGTYTGCISNIGSNGITIIDNSDGSTIHTIAAGNTGTYTLTNGSWSWVDVGGIGSCGACKTLTLSSCHVFSEKNFNWIGEFNYDFDYVCTKDSEVYGFKDQTVYKLNVEDEAFGTEAYVDVIFNPDMFTVKEFIRWNLSATQKPVRVSFYDFAYTLLGTVAADDIREYGNGFEQYVPLNNNTSTRIQKKAVIMRIHYDENVVGDVAVRSASVQYKNLR